MSAPTKTKAPMKLHLLPENVATLTYPVTAKKRTEKLQDIIAARGGILCENLMTVFFPVSIEDKRLKFVIPEDFEIATVFNRDQELNGLTIVQRGEQWTITREGTQRTHFTFAGDGVGDIVKNGRFRALKTLLGSCEIANAAREFLRGRCTKEAKS